jgi:high-affinity nickel permease
MFGLDDKVAGLADGHTLLLVVAVALLLGLRHATDPDHLAAVSTLIASERDDGTRRAGVLGLAWGLSHATTLILCGVPIVIAGAYLPAWARARAPRS